MRFILSVRAHRAFEGAMVEFHLERLTELLDTVDKTARDDITNETRPGAGLRDLQ